MANVRRVLWILALAAVTVRPELGAQPPGVRYAGVEVLRGRDGAATYQAPAIEGLRVVIIDGDEAANIVAGRIAAEPVIEVRDRDDRQVPGAVVRFLIRRTVRDRVSTVFRNGQAEIRTLTDAVGRARASGLTPLQPGPFEIEIQVSHQGQTATATVRHTNYATVADARAAGHEPSQSSSSNARQDAGAGGGGISGLAIAALVAGGAAGAGGAYYYRERSRESDDGQSVHVRWSPSSGVQSVTPFSFFAEATGFEAASLSYYWRFGDGATSTEQAPIHIYQSAGTYSVTMTVSDARRSAPMGGYTVTIYSLDGTWVSTANAPSVPVIQSLQLTQSANALSGVLMIASVPSEVPRACPVSGVAQSGSPLVILNQPRCLHPSLAPLVAMQYRLNLGADGQTLSGTWVQQEEEVGRSGTISPLRR